MCDFSKGFQPPEIGKVRPVVIVSPHHQHHSELYTVVPLSTTAPLMIRPCHFRFDGNPIARYDGKEIWAKCDLVVTISRTRLDRFKLSRGKYTAYSVTELELKSIRECLKYVLGIS